MRIFSKKAFKFSLDYEEYKVKAFSFNDAPEWIVNTSMFKLAEAEYSIEIIEDKKTQKLLENIGVSKKENKIREQAKNIGLESSNRDSILKLKKRLNRYGENSCKYKAV